LVLAACLAVGLLGACLAALGGLAASFSRGAWLGTSAALIVTAWLFHRWLRIALVVAAVLFALGAVGGSLNIVPSVLSDRLDSIVKEVRPFDAASATITDENFSTVERMAHWQAGWHMFRDHPLLGVGIGNFNVRYPDYYVRESFRVSEGHAHNIYIQMLAETGLAGLCVYLTLIAGIGFLALRVVRGAPPGLDRTLALGALGTVISVGVHNFFEDLHVLNLNITLGAIWCLAIAADQRWRASAAGCDVRT
jgi:O-antigen ligase